jgi:mannose-1-phosphate guanylyltransferase
MFIWRVDRILEEFTRQMPEFYTHLSVIEATLGTPTYEATLQRIWPLVTKQTIDYGVMEGARDVVVIPVDIGWTDVGSWGSLLNLLPTDQDGNILVGPHIGIDTHNCLVFSSKRLIATIGVQGLVIVDTDDALLICTKDREQEVREIVERLKQNGDDQWL